jgi:peptidyl-prolyl cis-trans isomerase A (cyclophilin A)
MRKRNGFIDSYSRAPHPFRRRPIRPALSVLLLVCLAGAALEAVGQTNGIYADFTTSMGGFTCQLDYSNAPKATANFIGLATGARAWLDLVSGRARTDPFYDGLTFHRVIAGFVIQAGSPNAQSTDGPGYAFEDEITSLLNFSQPMMLAMANSGTNSNGSQFFITVSSQPSLNNAYTIFGHVVSGSNIVDSISAVPTDTADKPLTNVVIQQVQIRRVGPGAQAFDINAQGLPVVTNLPLRMALTHAAANLSFANRQFADNRVYISTNLTDWSDDSLGIEAASPSTNSVSITNDVSQRFFSFAQIQYPSSTFAPKTLFNRTLTLKLTGTGTLKIKFNAKGGGTFTFGGSPGTVTRYTWQQEPYRGALWPIYYSNVIPMTLLLNFNSQGAGSVSGTAYPAPPKPSRSVSGTFTLAGG